ncbi:MAG TPA: hypothetical protein VL371_13600 [Gemmataceae bacterium]|jgi:hypothetical protein|nr:hypothetical protein [Gemmataceae bacterium]
MPTITAEGLTAAQLEKAESISEVRGTDGRFLGMFAPGTPEEARLYLHAWLSLDPAEVKRQKAMAEPTYSFAEVDAHLKSLEQEKP